MRFEFVCELYVFAHVVIAHRIHIDVVRVDAEMRVRLEDLLCPAVPRRPLGCGKNVVHEFGFDALEVAAVSETLNDRFKRPLFIALYFFGKFFVFFRRFEYPNVIFRKRLQCAHGHFERHGTHSVFFSEIDFQRIVFDRSDDADTPRAVVHVTFRIEGDVLFEVVERFEYVAETLREVR